MSFGENSGSSGDREPDWILWFGLVVLMLLLLISIMFKMTGC